MIPDSNSEMFMSVRTFVPFKIGEFSATAPFACSFVCNIYKLASLKWIKLNAFLRFCK